ncbi:MAG: alkaline phosphatase family protein, partial [Pseudomonadota bacterium]
MKTPVVVIGLDSADPKVIEAWLDAGELPVMASLRAKGVYGRLDNFEAFSAETPWTTFATGVSPSTTGYYSPLGFVEGTYDVTTKAAYNYEEFPPFYANPDLKCAIFDVPQVRVDERVNGIQVTAWGAHSPQAESASSPPELFDEIVRDYGAHPTLHRDYAVCVDVKTTLRLEPRLKDGIELRGKIAH